MWVYPPGDWISRWAVVLGGTLGIFAQLCLHVMDGPTTKGKLGGALTALAAVALVGLQVVGCVNEDEYYPIHAGAAMVFFLGYDAFMVGRTALVAARRADPAAAAAAAAARSSTSRGALLLQAACAVASCGATAARYAHYDLAARVGAGARAGALLAPIIEWADALAIISYFGVAVFAHGAATKTTGLRITAITNAA